MLSQILVFALLVVVISSKSIDESLFREETERIINGQDAKPGQFPWVIDEALTREETETERIVGGKSAKSGQFPWVVALHYNNQFICTASIISSTTVLTAAHCVQLNGKYQPADSFYAIANISRSAQSVRINFANLTHHPEYNNRSIDNDVAVFKTIEPIPFSDEVGPVCIAGPDTDIFQYLNATAMGWGLTSRQRYNPFKKPSLPDRLQYVEQLIVPNLKCSLLNVAVNEDKICAEGFFTGVCNGDSGGPLVHLSADQPPVEIGIASYINGVAGCGVIVPAVFTRVSSQYKFIMEAANDTSVCVVSRQQYFSF